MMIRATIVVAGAAALSGCFWVTTKHEGKQLRQEVASIETRLQAQEQTVGSRVAELKDVLAKATKLLARNSADLGADVDGLEREQAKLAGLVAEASALTEEIKAAQERDRKIFLDRITEIERRLVALAEQVNKTPNRTPAQLYQEGKTAFDGRDFASARESFKAMVIKYPDNPLADDAQYYRGEALYREKQYQLALGELQKVFEKYPGSNWAPEALYRAGEAALNLQWCTDARAYLNVLMRKYPKADVVKKARTKDAEIKRNAKNKKKCKS
jgi:tol-pal system protein YbgF